MPLQVPLAGGGAGERGVGHQVEPHDVGVQHVQETGRPVLNKGPHYHRVGSTKGFPAERKHRITC